MAVRTIAQLKALFETGDKPDGNAFADLIDTLFDQSSTNIGSIYNPTSSDLQNVGFATISSAIYIRVQNIVTVSGLGSFSVSSSSVLASFEIPLPIASTLGINDLSGVVNCGKFSGIINVDNNQANILLGSDVTVSGSYTFGFEFKYKIN